MVRRAYAPGMKSKRSVRSQSEYGKELREKQKLKNWYHLRERQFRLYVEAALQERGKVVNAGDSLIRVLESRLDNAVFRAGFCISRLEARQLVSHGHIIVNGKKIDIPSMRLKRNDVFSIKEGSKKKPVFLKVQNNIKKYKTPSWVELNAEKAEAKIIGDPSLDEAGLPVEVSSIFEFYSR